MTGIFVTDNLTHYIEYTHILNVTLNSFIISKIERRSYSTGEEHFQCLFTFKIVHVIHQKLSHLYHKRRYHK